MTWTDAAALLGVLFAIDTLVSITVRGIVAVQEERRLLLEAQNNTERLRLRRMEREQEFKREHEENR